MDVSESVVTSPPTQSVARYSWLWKWLAATSLLAVILSALAIQYVHSFRFYPSRFDELGPFSINDGVISNESLNLTIKPKNGWQFSKSPQDLGITVNEDRARERLICQLVGPKPAHSQLVYQPIISVSVRYHGDDFASNKNSVLRELVDSTLSTLNPQLKPTERTPVVEGRKFGDIGSVFCTMKFKEPSRTVIARKIYVIPQHLYDVVLRIDFSTGVEDYESFVLEGVEGVLLRRVSAVKKLHDASQPDPVSSQRARFYSGE